MKLLIMSDTHGDAEIIETVKNYYKDVEAVIHCGDSELPYDHPYLEGVERVRGNCDRTDARYPDERLVELGDERIFIAHGHHFNVKSTLMSITYRAMEQNASICCFGHSHLLGAEKIGNTLFLNPGSLRKPRGRKEKSFIVLEVTSEQYIVNCYSEENILLEQVTFRKEN